MRGGRFLTNVVELGRQVGKGRNAPAGVWEASSLSSNIKGSTREPYPETKSSGKPGFIYSAAAGNIYLSF